MAEEPSCDHDLVYLLRAESSGDEKRGRCTECSELVDLTGDYAKDDHLRWEEDEQISPVFKRIAPDQYPDQYNILTKPGADIKGLKDALEKYGTILTHLKDTGILRIECTAKDGQRLSADYKGRGAGSPLSSIMVLTRRERKDS